MKEQLHAIPDCVGDGVEPVVPAVVVAVTVVVVTVLRRSRPES